MDAKTIRRAAGKCLKRGDLSRRLRLLGVRPGAQATRTHRGAPRHTGDTAASVFTAREPGAGRGLPLFDAPPPA
jgi:DNA polymerase-4